MHKSPSDVRTYVISDPPSSEDSPPSSHSSPSLDELYRTHGPRLLRDLRAKCNGNLEDAKDLSQRIWLIVARRMQQITIDKPWNFIEKIMNDEVNGWLRTRIRKHDKLRALVPPTELLEPSEPQEASPELWACLERLSSLDQRIVMAFYGLQRPGSRSSPRPVSISRPTPPYLRVVSNRTFYLEIDDEMPPRPLTDQEQAQSLSETTEEPWSPRRVKVRRCRALSALEICLREQGMTGRSHRYISDGEREKFMEKLRGNGRRTTALLFRREGVREGRQASHPSPLLLMLTSDDAAHPAQRHLLSCHSCQESFAAVRAVDSQLIHLAQYQKIDWQRRQEETRALEEVWATLQGTLALESARLETETPRTETPRTETPDVEGPKVEPLEAEPIPIVETEEAEPEIPGSVSPGNVSPGNVRPANVFPTQAPATGTARTPLSLFSHGWKLLGGLTLAASLLLAVGITRQEADPLGLGASGQTRGGETSHIAEETALPPPAFKLEMNQPDVPGWFPVRLSRGADPVATWRGEYVEDASLRLTVLPPLNPLQRWLALVGLGRSWSGTLYCTSDEQEDHTESEKPSNAQHMRFWQQSQAPYDSPLVLPLPPASPQGGAMVCQFQQTLGSGEQSSVRILLKPTGS